MEFLEGHKLELYNLKDDIGERTNLAEKNPEKTKELQAKLVAWRDAIKAPMPTPNTHITPPGEQKGGKGKKKKSDDE